jgi:hypothetical protein
MRWIFNARVIGCSLLVALILLVATLGLLWYTRPGPAAVGPSTAVLNVIPAPTNTSPPPTATRQQSSTPTSRVPPSPGPGMIVIEGYVQIAGTQGDGLRLRTEPGLDSQVRILGAESEVFQVKDGPVEEDGYTWWYLVGPYDDSRRGWAVSNYLEVVQNPL